MDKNKTYSILFLHQVSYHNQWWKQDQNVKTKTKTS